MPLSPSAIQSLSGLPAADPWLALFASRETPSGQLAHFLASGVVDVFHRDKRGVSLLHAFLSRWKNDPGYGTAPSYRAEAPPIPATPEGPWDPVSTVTDAVLAGLLVGSGLDPFDPHPEASGPDALDVALGQGWDSLALHCLQSPSCPSAAALNARSSPLLLAKDKTRLPWPHVLANVDRPQVLAAWLARPGMSPDLADHHGRSPLFYATSREAVEVLLAAGARTDIQARDGRTAIETWANPPAGTLLHGVPPGERHAMQEALASLGKAPSSPSYEDWVRCEDPGRLFAATPMASLANARIVRTTGPHSVEWGFVGFLAWSWLSLQTSRNTPVVRNAKDVVSGLMEKLPASAWAHESLPGVPDQVLLRLAAYAIDTGRVNERYQMAAALDAGPPLPPVALSHARLTLLPHLRGEARTHQADELAKELKAWASTADSASSRNETEADVQAWLDVGVAACNSRWMRTRMGAVALRMLETPSRVAAMRVHPGAVDWLRAVLVEFPEFVAKQHQSLSYVGADPEKIRGTLAAATSRLFDTMTALAPQLTSQPKLVDAAARRMEDASPELASRFHAWLLEHTTPAVPAAPSVRCRM